jgi:hypothetical protein
MKCEMFYFTEFRTVELVPEYPQFIMYLLRLKELKVAFGERRLKRTLVGFLFHGMMKKELTSDEPWKRISKQTRVSS